STPRALVVSAYQKVAVHHFAAIETSLEKDPIAISVQYRANQVRLKNVQLKGYERAEKPIRVAETTENIKIE
ncbi:MAG: hypothetical protein ABS889_07005, partial [Desemzia incerta]